MPSAIITTPDGRRARVTGTEEEIRAAAQQIQANMTPPSVGSELKAATAGGVGRGLSNAFGAMEGLTNWVYRGITGRDMPGANDVAGQFREYVGEQYGETRTLPGRMLEAPIRGATTAAALPVGPLTPAAMAAGAVGESAAQATGEAGGGPLAQMAASVVGGVGTSMGMAARASRAAAARRAAESGARPPGDLQIAERLAAERAARSLGGLGEGTRQQRVAQAIQALDDEVAARAAGQIPISTAGVLERQAPGVASMQRALARVPGAGDELAARAAEQRGAIESRLAAGAALERSGAPAALEDAYTSVQDDLSRGVDLAYKEYRKLRGTTPPPVSARPLSTMAARIKQEAGTRFPSNALPDEKLLDDLIGSKQLTLKEIDEFRTLATNSASLASRAGNKSLARNWYRLRDATERTLSRFALGKRDNARKVDALRSAIGKRRELGQMFDERHASAQMFDYDVLVDGMRKRVMTSKDPAGEIQRLRMIVSQADNATDATRALGSVTFDSTFGPSAFADLTAGEFKKARNALLEPRKRAAIDAAFYPGRAAELQTQFERARRALSETVGTPAEAHKTGSNLLPRVWDAVTDLKTIAGVHFTRSVMRRLQGVSEETMNKALIDFLRDPEYAAQLLRDAQAQNLESFLARVTRSAQEGARPTIGRIGELTEE